MPISSSSSAPVKARILLVDDNTLGLSARKSVLEELGHRVTAVTSPREAITCLESHKFDLVITDFRMPEMTGSELIGWIRERTIECPTILISGFVDTLGLTVANTGADIVIQKSAHEINHLLRAVKSLLKRRPNAARKPPGSDLPPKARTKKASS